MAWTYKDKELLELSDFPKRTIGFVYIIENLLNSKKYIGKKVLYFQKFKQVNKKKKRIKVESDWATYFGSNEELKAEVKKHGEEHFKREVLHFCADKTMLSFLELKEQILQGAMESTDFYNGEIFCRIRKVSSIMSLSQKGG